MHAMLLNEAAPMNAHPLALRDLATPQPGPGELVMRVTACGVCRSNLHMIEGDWLENGVPSKFPIVPGHEVVGRVESLGPDVTTFRVGDRVGVQPLWSTCLHCEYCLTAREMLCRSKKITGEDVDGGYAEQMLAKEAHTYAVPDALSDAEAAPLFCPGITAYGAVGNAQLAPGKTVALFGVGGVGHMVLQFARLAGAETIAVARSKNHLDLATELGATPLDSSREDPVAVLKGRGGVDASIVFAPSSAIVEQALAATKPGGIIVIGVHSSIGRFLFYEGKTIVGSLLGSRQQMREVLQLAAAGKVKAQVATYPLTDAEKALSDLKAGDVRARAVLTV